jgi:hypothetical protein
MSSSPKVVNMTIINYLSIANNGIIGK